MGRSPDRPYLRPPGSSLAVGQWEMWQLRGLGRRRVLLVCGTAALLVGVEIVRSAPPPATSC